MLLNILNVDNKILQLMQIRAHAVLIVVGQRFDAQQPATALAAFVSTFFGRYVNAQRSAPRIGIQLYYWQEIR